MTLQQLEYTVALYKTRHFARAAEQCGVTQPTLSSMIQKLEEELGVTLFDRRQHPVGMTPTGLHLIEHASRILRLVQRLRDKVEEEKNSLRGTFNIGILPTIAPYLIPRFLPQLMEQHPEMDIRISEMKTDHIRTALEHGDLDAGILAETEGLERLNRTTLYYEQFYAYVAEGDRLYTNGLIKTTDLSGSYLWLLDEGHCFRDQLVKFCQLKAANLSKRAYRLGSIETFMRVVESGKGVTFIPQLAVLQLSEQQHRLVRPFAIPIPTRQIVLTTARGFVRTSILNIIGQSVREAVPKEMLQLNNTQQQV